MAQAAFDPDQYLKEKTAAPSASSSFDPDQYLQEKNIALTGKDAVMANINRMNESGDASNDALLNTVTLGYLPQIKAGAKHFYNVATGEDKPGEYVKMRDQEIADMKAREEKYPGAHREGTIVGLVAPMLATGGASAPQSFGAAVTKSALTGAGIGAAANPGDVEGVVDPIQLKERARNAAIGAGVGTAAGVAAPLVGAVAEKAGEKLGKVAEKAAVNATGATGKQASNFADNAGRELLDRGIVSFGDTQEKIASKASKAVDDANKQIDQSLKKLQDAGVTVDANDVYNVIRSKINEFKTDPSKADIVKNLETELENLISATDAKGGTQYGVKEAEQIKRGYNRKAGNWADPEKGMAGKEMYQATRGAVENAAKEADPATAKLFEEGKKSYGLMAPIEEAAERRAATVQQHPAGGFLDVTSGVAGASAGGPLGAIAAPIARRFIAPRIASSTAATADAVSKFLLQSPTLEKMATENPALFKKAVSDFSEKAARAHPISASAQNELNRDSATPSSEPQSQTKPLRGKDKWASDGFDKLEAHAGDSGGLDRAALMKDPKARELLIQASDLKPGSKAMDKVLTQIKNRVGKDKN